MKGHISMRRLVTLVLLVVATSSLALSSEVSQRGTSKDIRKFNLKTFAYRDAVKTLRQDWDEAVKFIKKNGEDDDWVQEKNIEGFEAKPTYGDMTGDRSDEAAVNVQYGLGGSGSFSSVFIYTLKNGSPSLLTRVQGGDRAHGGIESVKILNGQLIVERYRPTADDCNACYGYIETTKYKWLGNRLNNVGVQVRKYTDPKVNNKQRQRRRTH
jgi:hypothetical protein